MNWLIKAKIKRLFFIIRNVLGLPSLFIHELSHSFGSFIVGKGFESIKIDIKFTMDINKISYVKARCVSYKSLNKFKDVVGLIFPAITLLTIFILMLVLSSKILFFIFIYELIFIKWSMPSCNDLIQIKDILTNFEEYMFHDYRYEKLNKSFIDFLKD